MTSAKLSYTHSGTSALMDDGARLSWGNENLTCTCVTAKRCPRADRQMCKHIIQILRDRVDRVVLHPKVGMKVCVVQVCLMLPTTPDQRPVFASVVIDLQRKHVMTSGSAGATLFILDGRESRSDLRNALIPFLIHEIATGVRCDTCADSPASHKTLLANRDNLSKTNNLSPALADLLSIRESGKCVRHYDEDLIPF